MLRPFVALADGFATIEGPYPSMGVATRLAWQISARASVELLDEGKRGADDATFVLAIDLVLPCRQSLVVEAGSACVRFADLPQSSWTRPTRLLLSPGRLPGGAITIVLSSEHHIVDDADRTLYAALLGVSIVGGQDASAFRANPYDMPDMTFEVVSH